ncbi:MAG TPA: His/Gly/Thr/Pro-type tRNA ligase C-terminal domain-containing protein, partial [Chthoniobacterales bacterium]
RGAFLVIADESRRPDAIGLAAELRRSGITVDYSLRPAKVWRQFEQAEALRAKYAVVSGQEWPGIRIKELADRTERILSIRDLPGALWSGR